GIILRKEMFANNSLQSYVGIVGRGAGGAGPDGRRRGSGPRGRRRSAGPGGRRRSAGPGGRRRSAGPGERRRGAGPGERRRRGKSAGAGGPPAGGPGGRG